MSLVIFTIVYLFSSHMYRRHFVNYFLFWFIWIGLQKELFWPETDEEI